MFDKMEKLYEPINILDTLENRGNVGMSENDLAFLCGCIKKYRPRKLVEIGTAAGGTMAVIMECCRMLKLDVEIFSVDISEYWYMDFDKETGYVVKELKKRSEYQSIRHNFILGETLGSAIEKIGESIDFIILDTMHSLPGELLDFISAAKWISQNALVVFHDVGQCQLGIGSIYGKPFEYASLVAFSCLCGKKYWNRDVMNYFDLPNIAAVELSDDFSDHIDNLFAALFINWDYIPDSKSLGEYRNRISKDYGEKYLAVFEQALESNEYSLYKRGGLHIPIKKMKYELNDVIEKANDIYVYGDGIIGGRVAKYVQIKGKKVSGHITTGKEGDSIEIKEFVQKRKDDSVIILGLDEKYHWDVIQLIKRYGLENNIFPKYGIGFRELMTVIEQELDSSDIYNNNGYEHRIIESANK